MKKYLLGLCLLISSHLFAAGSGVDLTKDQLHWMIYDVAYVYAPYGNDQITHLKDYPKKYHELLLAESGGQESFNRNMPHNFGFTFEKRLVGADDNGDSIIDQDEQERAAKSDYPLRKFLDYIHSEYKLSLDMAAIVKKLDQDTPQGPEHVERIFFKGLELLHERPILWIFNTNLDAFFRELNLLPRFKDVNRAALILTFFDHFSAPAQVEWNALEAKLKNYIQVLKPKGDSEPKLIAKGTVSNCNPMDYLKLVPVKRIFETEEKFSVVKNGAHWELEIQSLYGEVQNIVLPNGSEINFPQIRSYEHNSRPYLFFYEGIFVASNEDGLHSAYRKDEKSGQWKLVSTSYPSLREFNNYDTDFSQMIDSSGAAKYQAKPMVVAENAQGKQFIVYNHLDGNFWKVFELPELK